MFRNCMKLSAKHTEHEQLMQKFVPQSNVVIFPTNVNDPTHWTQNCMFWRVSYCLGAFGIVSQLHETRCKTG